MPCRADFSALLLALADAGVEFVLVGGLAAVAQGVPITTFDVDIVHARAPENIARLAAFLLRVGARVRGHPPDVDLLPSEAALSGPGHQLLQTKHGALDLLGAIERGLVYDDLLPDTRSIELHGRAIRVLKLRKLRDLKAGSTRPKDRLVLRMIDETLLVGGEARDEPQHKSSPTHRF